MMMMMTMTVMLLLLIVGMATEFVMLRAFEFPSFELLMIMIMMI